MALSEHVIKKINSIRGNFPTTQALVIPTLIETQNELGWISEDSMKDVAAFLEMPLMKIKEVVTFYTMFNLSPVGKVNLQLCVNISCWLNGAEKIKHCIEKRLQIKSGETTKDGNYTLSEVECLASCGTAPVLQVNQDYYENLSENDLFHLMDELDKKLAGNEKLIGKTTYNAEVWP
jgi:NADH-quinone oxidoreductase E subunit